MINKKICIADLLDFDIADYLNSREAVVEYLTAMSDGDDPGMLAVALIDIARASRFAAS